MLGYLYPNLKFNFQVEWIKTEMSIMYLAGKNYTPVDNYKAVRLGTYVCIVIKSQSITNNGLNQSPISVFWREWMWGGWDNPLGVVLVWTDLSICRESESVDVSDSVVLEDVCVCIRSFLLIVWICVCM
jgi:hypothetical protein